MHNPSIQAYCDQFANVIHINKIFIQNNKINAIKLSLLDKELIVKLDSIKTHGNDKTVEINYPPTKNLYSKSIKITYLIENQEVLYSQIINYIPWSLHAESVNSRTINGRVTKKPNFIIRPVKLFLKQTLAPYSFEPSKRQIKDNGMEEISFKWHLQVEHDPSTILDICINNYGNLYRIKSLARLNDFAFNAELTAKKKSTSEAIKQNHYKIAIIMPIYNGIKETIEAINSILCYIESDQTDSGLKIRLILGLDNPKNIKMKEAILEKYQKKSNIEIIINSSNLGFIQNCNQMFAMVEEDEEVLLINSDVICPNRNWIRKLINVSDMSDKIGTVTPMSNCASIFSFPEPNAKNTCIQPDVLEEVNDALDLEIDQIITVPSCHGFCVLIRKTRLPFLLRLDPVFGKGYGEENDLSQKIQMSGLINVACPSVFIYHHESISFSEDKTPLLRKNLKLLGDRYPSYHEDVQNWITKDPLRTYRNDAIKRLMLSSLQGHKTILHISHGRGGGTQEYIEYRINQNKDYNHVLIVSAKRPTNRCTLSARTIKDNDLISEFSLSINEIDIGHEFQWLKDICNVEKTIIHSLLDYADPLQTLGFILNDDCTREVIIHDYEWISPNLNLLGNDLQIRPVKQSETLFSLDNIERNLLFSKSLKEHQRDRGYFLRSKSDKICPSEVSRELITQCYPEINHITTKYHDLSGNKLESSVETSLARLQKDGIRLAVIGGIGGNKGYKLLCNIARNLLVNKSRIELVVFGYTANDDQLTCINPNVTITGKYNGNEEFKSLLEVYKPNSSLFLSQWPETYCYTLSLAFENNLWPFVLNYGAIGERVQKSKFGDILLSEDPSEIIKQIEQRSRT